MGQDLSIGYASRDEEMVQLFLTELFTFRVLEPAAALGLRHQRRATKSPRKNAAH